MVGRYMLLCPASAPAKPAFSVFAHPPNPIQEGSRSAFIISRRHTRSVEEHRFDQFGGVLFSEILGILTCGRVRFRGPKDTFDGSAQDFSPCEADINEGPVDGRVERRTGVHVESEVVLKCEGNNEGACDMLC